MSAIEPPRLTLDAPHVSRALRLVLWGSVICAIDITSKLQSGGYGIAIDFVNDLVGALMIATGVFRLARVDVGGSYRTYMTFVKVVAVLAVLDGVRQFVVFPSSPLLSRLLGLWGLLDWVAILVFCWAMQRLCDEAGLVKSEGSWRTSSLLVGWLALLSKCVLMAVGWVAWWQGWGSIWKPSEATAAAMTMLLIVTGIVFVLIPFVHVLISLERTHTEVDDRAKWSYSRGSGDTFEPPA